MTDQVQDPMEYIWEKVPKTQEGLIHYLAGDIPYLYRNGFVDTTRFTYQQWKEAFQDCMEPDGTYLVSKGKFLSLRVFRYIGPVFQPFDPAKVREGEWKDEDLQKLFDRSIKPSSSITQEIFWNSVKALKGQGLVKNGNLNVDSTVKRQLGYLIERFPSPRRRLEKEVSRIRQERDQQIQTATKNRDSSLFVAGKTSSEVKMDDLQRLQSSAPIKQPDVPLKAGPAVDLKSLKRPPKKIAG